MTDLVQLIQEADVSMLNLENARTAVEAAKAQLEAAKEDFEQAKTAFDQTIAKADEISVPRAKLKKLVEERSAALLASGLYTPAVIVTAKPPKAAKPAKQKKSSVSAAEDSAENPEVDADSAHDSGIDDYQLPEIDRTQAMM